jgi:hypothetical protein
MTSLKSGEIISPNIISRGICEKCQKRAIYRNILYRQNLAAAFESVEDPCIKCPDRVDL